MKRIAGSILVLSLFVSVGSAAQYVRISASEFAQSPARVAALKKAVKTMRARDTASKTSATYRTSWQYWAATHGYFGTGPNSSGSAAAFKAQAPSICAGLPPAQLTVCKSYYAHVVSLTLPNDGGITSKVWGTCQHSDAGPPNNNMQFFTWHRMYLKYYERVLRKASGDPNFTLPYWNYYDEMGPGGNGIALPALVRGTTTASLYDKFRTPGLNTNTNAIDEAWASNEQAFDFNDFQNFSYALEQQPHGMMHCGAGFGCQAPDMGIVPVAGLDPVFYMHHANIDRLFQCWLVRKAHGAPITLAWAKANLGMPQSWFDQRWFFVDENGASVSMTVAELFQPGGIDYTYEQTTDCVQPPPAAAPEAPMVEAVAAPRRTAVSSGAISLRGKSQSVPLAPSTLEGPEPELPSAIHVEPGRSVLVISGVEIEGNPAVTYNIYIARNDAPENRVYIATLNYFNVLTKHHPGHAGVRGHDLLFYDVTSELAKLGNPSESEVAVTFEPSSGSNEAPNVTASAGTVTVRSIRIQTAKAN
ncbi:MAG: tyrosinase family protein [Acidobacteriota bacterium]